MEKLYRMVSLPITLYGYESGANLKEKDIQNKHFDAIKIPLTFKTAEKLDVPAILEA